MMYLLYWRSKKAAMCKNLIDWVDDAQAERLGMEHVTKKGGDLIDIYPLGEGLMEKTRRLANEYTKRG